MTVSLITGASGFIGRHTARRLVAAGDEVHLLQRASSAHPVLDELAAAGAKVHRYDAPDEIEGRVQGIAPDRVFHLATLYLKDHTPADVDAMILANVTFGTHLLEGLVGSGARVISTMSYFQFRDGRPHPFSLYSATKQAFLDICDFYRSTGLDIRQLVVYDTYGPDDERVKLIPLLVDVARGVRDSMTLGSPDQEIDLCEISDAVDALLAASGEDAAPVTTIGGAPVRIGDIVATLERLVGRELAVAFDTAAPVSDQLHRAGAWPAPPGWSRRVGLESGLRQLVG